MAVTNPSDVTSSIPRVYARRTLDASLRETFWDHLSSAEGGSAALIQHDELLNKPGETMYIQVTAPLSGDGQSGDTSTLEGNEEKLATDSISVTPVYYRHGVRINNRAEKKSLLDLRGMARPRLSEWGSDKLDTLRFTAFTSVAGGDAGYGTQRLRRVGGGANDDAMTAANRMTLAELSKCKYILLDTYKAKPFQVSGEEFLIAVVNPWQEYDLKVTDTNYNTAMREAGVRGDTNPIFTGATAVWDGIVIKKASRVPSVANTGGVAIAGSLLFGREAFVEAWGSQPTWVERDFDYGHDWGVGYGFDYGCKRSFEDYSMQIRSSAVPQV